jgi:uncharacterized membrane protein
VAKSAARALWVVGFEEHLELNAVGVLEGLRGTRLVVQSLCGFGIGGSWFTIGAWRLRDSVTGRPEVAGVRTNVLFDHRCNHVFHRCSQVAGPAARPLRLADA